MTFSGGKAASEEMHMITDYLRKNSGSAWFSGIIAMDNERLASIVHADECIAIGGRQRRAVIQVPQPFSGGGSAHTVVRSLIVGSKWVRVRACHWRCR